MSRRYHYEVGAVRHYRWHGHGDVRAAHVPDGWEATAEMTDTHPITGERFKRAEWWVREEYVGTDTD